MSIMRGRSWATGRREDRTSVTPSGSQRKRKPCAVPAVFTPVGSLCKWATCPVCYEDVLVAKMKPCYIPGEGNTYCCRSCYEVGIDLSKLGNSVTQAGG